ncbi:hypothetical protein PMAYCL1PPCAC_28404, partial [Pristionchus mayeri]
ITRYASMFTSTDAFSPHPFPHIFAMADHTHPSSPFNPFTPAPSQDVVNFLHQWQPTQAIQQPPLDTSLEWLINTLPQISIASPALPPFNVHGSSLTTAIASPPPVCPPMGIHAANNLGPLFVSTALHGSGQSSCTMQSLPSLGQASPFGWPNMLPFGSSLVPANSPRPSSSFTHQIGVFSPPIHGSSFTDTDLFVQPPRKKPKASKSTEIPSHPPENWTMEDIRGLTGGGQRKAILHLIENRIKANEELEAVTKNEEEERKEAKNDCEG